MSLTQKLKIGTLEFLGNTFNQQPILNAAKFMRNEDVHYAPTNVTPNYHLHDYNDINVGALQHDGIEVIVDDVDGTLMGYHGKKVAPSFKDKFEEHKNYFKMFIVSNSSERRYRELGHIFPDVPVLKMYEDNGSPLYRVLLIGRDEIFEVIDGEEFTHYDKDIDDGPKDDKGKPVIPLGMDKSAEITKPDVRLNEFVRYLAGNVEPSKIVWIGDRLSAEITTAGQAGAKSIWVDEYIGEQKEPWYISFARKKEAKIANELGFLDKYGLIKPISP